MSCGHGTTNLCMTNLSPLFLILLFVQKNIVGDWWNICLDDMKNVWYCNCRFSTFLESDCTIEDIDCYVSDEYWNDPAVRGFGGHHASTNDACKDQCRNTPGCEVGWYNKIANICFKYTRGVCDPNGVIYNAFYANCNIIYGKWQSSTLVYTHPDIHHPSWCSSTLISTIHPGVHHPPWHPPSALVSTVHSGNPFHQSMITGCILHNPQYQPW